MLKMLNLKPRKLTQEELVKFRTDLKIRLENHKKWLKICYKQDDNQNS